MRTQAGHVVQPRKVFLDDPTRRAALLGGDGKPGTCEVCGELEKSALSILYGIDKAQDKTLRDYVGSKGEYVFGSAGVRLFLACKKCKITIQALTGEVMSRVRVVLAFLERGNITRDDILPEVDPLEGHVVDYRTSLPKSY
jgi:hypothetical protein